MTSHDKTDLIPQRCGHRPLHTSGVGVRALHVAANAAATAE